MSTSDDSPNTSKLWLVSLLAEPFYTIEIYADSRNRARYLGALEMNVRYVDVSAYPAERRICPERGLESAFRVIASPRASCVECGEWKHYD